MQVWVVRAAGAVLVGGGDEAARVLPENPGLTAAGDARLVFEIGERRLPRRLMGLAHGEARVVVAEGVQADALGCSEHEVEPGDGPKLTPLSSPLSSLPVDPLDGDRPRLGVLAKPITRGGIDARDQPAEVTVSNNADEIEPACTPASPHAGGLAAACVVFVKPLRDGPLVVRFLAWCQLRDAEHVETVAHLGAYMSLLYGDPATSGTALTALRR